MNIAYVCADPGIPAFGRKGASIHVQEVIRALHRQGAHVTLFANRFDGEPPTGLTDVVMHRLAPLGKGFSKAGREQAAYAANLELLEALDSYEKFDMIYERYSLWSYMGMQFAQNSGLPGLLEINAPLIEEQSRYRGLVDHRLAEHVAQQAFGAASALIAVSKGVADYVEGFPEARGRVHIVPNGVDVERFQQADQPALSPEPGTFVVGFVGSLKSWHGLDILVDQFALAYDQDNGMRLLIVGDGPGRGQLEEALQARQLRHAVHFTGAANHEEVPAWLASMDAAIAPYPDLPNFYFSPLKIYEYMAAGLPVAASSIGQIPSVITHEENGLLCPPGDAQALAAATLRLRNNPSFARTLGTQAHATVADTYTWNTVAARIMALAGYPELAQDAAQKAVQGAAQKKESTRPKKPETLPEAMPGLWRIVKRLRPQLAGQWRLIAVAVTALLAGIGFRLLEPWPLKYVIDFLSGSTASFSTPLGTLAPNTVITLSALAIVLTVAARAAATYFSTVAMALAGNRILTQVRGELYQHLLRLSLSYHNHAKAGDLLTRLVGDIGRLQEVAVTALLPLLISVLTFVGMIGVMFWINWQLALLSLLAFPLTVLTMTRFSGQIKQAARKQRMRESVMAANAGEAFSAMQVVQAFGLEQALGKSFSASNKKSLKEGVRAKRLSAQLERAVDVFIALGTAVVVWYGARVVQSGALTIGDLVVFLSYLKSSFRPMRNMAKYTGRIAKAVASGERVMAVLDTEPDIVDAPNAVKAPPLNGHIRLNDVTFAYGDWPTLRRLNIEIRAGQRVALVGPSGAGKSTLISLLLRLYDPTTGHILYDGQDIRSFTLASLRSQISIVLQESVLFGVSVRENIAFGAPAADAEEIEAAARLANAHDFIRALPDGYDTVLGERGATLSGGQRQRIAIARAAIRNAPIVILDEPTASLDEENQQAVQSALERLARGRTTLLVTHDLKAATSADLILHMENGQICEQGSHAALMALEGRYAALYSLQNEDPVSDRAASNTVSAADAGLAEARTKANGVEKHAVII